MYHQSPPTKRFNLFNSAVATISSLPSGLGYNDVICGRHKDAGHNIGNRRFRILVAIHIQKYIHAPTRAHKSMVIRDLVDTIQGCGGRFVHQRKVKRNGASTTVWDILEEKQIYDKVGHAFRDMLASVKVKSEMNNLLSPSQSTPSCSDSTVPQLYIETPCTTTISIDITPPLLSFQVTQGSNDIEKQGMVNDLNVGHSIADYDDYNDDNNVENDSLYQLTDEELEQCQLTSNAIQSFSCSSFDGHDIYKGKNSFRNVYAGASSFSLLRNSIQSFQCIAL